jgi:hypothetical protein
MLHTTSTLLQEALDEIDSYCDFNKWLNEIHLFCKKWTEKSVREFKGEQAFTIEVVYRLTLCMKIMGLNFITGASDKKCLSLSYLMLFCHSVTLTSLYIT